MWFEFIKCMAIWCIQNFQCYYQQDFQICMFLYFLIYFSFKPIVDYIDDQFERYLQEELKVKRVLHSYHDTRIHACLYFIAPTGHS